MAEPRIPRTNDPKELERWRLALLGEKGLIPKLPGATLGNVAEWATGGVIRDSGVATDDIILGVTGTATEIDVAPGPDQTVILSLAPEITGALNKARQYYFSGF